MTINRYTYGATGRCEAVVSDGLVYAVATDPHCADGIAQQTQNTMEDLDRILESAGSGRAGLIQATVYLRNVKQKPEMDAVWNKWIGPFENWPQRACVGVELDEGYLIEVVVIAKVL